MVDIFGRVCIKLWDLWMEFCLTRLHESFVLRVVCTVSPLSYSAAGFSSSQFLFFLTVIRSVWKLRPGSSCPAALQDAHLVPTRADPLSHAISPPVTAGTQGERRSARDADSSRHRFTIKTKAGSCPSFQNKTKPPVWADRIDVLIFKWMCGISI